MQLITGEYPDIPMGKFIMQIIEYDPKYKSEFVRLNTEWLQALLH